MKRLLLVIIVALAGSQAFAVNRNSSWDEIRDNDGYDVRIADPSIDFNGSHVSVFDVCYLPATDQLRTLKEVTVYERIYGESGETPEIFRPVGKSILFTSMSYTDIVQVGSGEETELKYVPAKYKLSYKIGVYADGTENVFQDLLFTKAYTIANCL
jgi:hypothetical protein